MRFKALVVCFCLSAAFPCHVFGETPPDAATASPTAATVSPVAAALSPTAALPPTAATVLPAAANVSASASTPAKEERAAKPQKVKLDLRDADIQAVVNLLARWKNLIVVMGDDVKAKVTINSPREMSVDEAYAVVMAVLDTKGITITCTDRFLKVMMKRDAVQRPVDTYYGLLPESVPAEDRVVTHVIPLKNANASEVLGSIRALISTTGNAFDHKNTNSIIITDVATNIRRLLAIIGHMDVVHAEPAGDEKTSVYAVKYLKSKDLADALGKVFGEKKQQGAPEIRITPVDTANAIIVTAGKDMHPQIQSTIDRLDTRKRQVLIEAKIVEATVSNGVDFGVNLTKLLFSAGEFGNSITMAGKLSDPFITYTVTSDRLTAALEMAASKGIINILSSPRVLTSDNSKAKIVVADEQPILKSVTDLGSTVAGGTGKTVSDFVYKDVGIELEVTPRINVDRDVALDVTFKISSIISEVTFPGGIQAPKIGKRESNTSVTIMDNHTLVIGGLMKDSKRDERVKVPVLGDIPFIGFLFSRLHKVNERTELLVFITPHVVANTEDGGNLTKSELDAVGHDLKLLNSDGSKETRK